MNTEFDMTLDRDDNEITISVVASGEIDPRDPSVGIMRDGIGYVTIESVLDEDGNALTLNRYERETVEAKAHEKLCEELDAAAY